MNDRQLSITLSFPMTEQNTKLAREMLTRAVQLDGGAADAAAWLANLTMSDYLNGWNDAGQEALREATGYAAKALAASSPPALAYYAQGFVHRANGRHRQAREAFQRARTIDPKLARAYAHEGAQLINLGEWEAGRKLVDQAIKLDPDNPSIGIFYYMKGRSYFFEAAAGDNAKFTEAIHWLEQSRATRDNLWYNWAYLIAAYHLAGKTKDAKEELVRFKAKYRTLGIPEDVRNRLEARNPDGDSHQATMRGRNKFLDAIRAIW